MFLKGDLALGTFRIKRKMTQIKTILLQKSVFADNDKEAANVREYLSSKGVFLVNVMSSPGAGKTTTLVALINKLKDVCRVGVMEADIDSDVDAVTVAKKTGVPSVQLHTGGMCHLDAGMTMQGVKELGEDFDIIFLENVGNLVCPAEYDTGAHLNMTILSVPEGDEKPLKYPLVYEKCQLVVINKTDALEYFPFDIERAKTNVFYRNKEATVIPVSAKNGNGIDDLKDYFMKQLSVGRK